MIQLNAITKQYSHGVRALHDVSLEVKAGEIFGIVGQSGAGKSTLLRCINLLEMPTHGEVWVNGDELTQLPDRALRAKRHQMGMIFQHFNLLNSANVFDNIALPLRLQAKNQGFIQEQVSRLLQLVKLEDRAQHYPEQLSGGQKQRVAIARALATNPNILLCDEATSALDPVATQSVLKLLEDINQSLGITIVLITHEMDVVKSICHQVAVLEQGELIEQGNILDIFAKPNHPVTKQLTQQVLFQPLPENLAQKLLQQPGSDTKPLVRLIFMGNSTDKPILQTMHDTYEVSANIVQANLESIHHTTVGYTVCELSGEQQNIDKALEYLQQMQVKTEVLGYVA